VVSPQGPATAVGLAGSTGQSSTATSTLPTCTPLEKYSKAPESSDMLKVFVGRWGSSGSAAQTSSRSFRQRSGCRSINTSKCAVQ